MHYIYHIVEFEEIKPRLDALSNAHEEDLARAADLERRISSVLRQYATRVCFSVLPFKPLMTFLARLTPCRSSSWNGTTSFLSQKTKYRGWNGKRQIKSASDMKRRLMDDMIPRDSRT